ncbi:MAG: class I SAM-dependent methyltransferase [Pseudomonadota bacterium]
MSGFSSQWLSLREPIDHAARNKDVLAEVVRHLDGQTDITLVDVGSGAGSTLRALDPILDRRAQWRLIDNDPDLLDVARASLVEGSDETSRVTTHLADLSASLDAVLQGDADLVTTSAFLDLVSSDWLDGFVAALAEAAMPFYGALSYDGRAGCTPVLVEDQAILEAFNAHQGTDKGFGKALGPNAADYAIQRFEAAGFQVISGLSDWQASGQDVAFQRMLLDGWHGAAVDIRPDKRTDFDHWLSARQRLIEAGQNTSFVGHVDFLALPPSL